MKQIILFLTLFSFISCSQDPDFFELLEGSQVGVDFNNKLSQTPEMNILDYMYFYNGGGIAAGDFNNDGLIDLFFSGNQVQNEIYLNQGDFSFIKTTDTSFPNLVNTWSTGVSVVDINSDGLLDIYVCELGDFRSNKGFNKLYICQEIKNGIPIYKEESAKYGLNFSGFSTQSSFFDYDLDGDLDMFLLNHTIHNNNAFAPRANFIGRMHPTAGDQFFENINGTYSNVTKQSLIHSNEIGYGLGIAVSDINKDGYPDIYIGNDFHENDYLYINQKDGTFKEDITNQIMHTSRFSMGVDIADVNNDGFQDIISLDMLPFDPEILRRSEGDDPLNTFNYKLRFGYNHQYARNTLQLNNRNGTFSEVAMFAGIHATDWSWSPLLADYNNDGLKDLFVSNGIPKRMNDIDYINFISSHQVQQKSEKGTLESSDVDLLASIPEIKLENQMFFNNGDVTFSKVNHHITGNKVSYSNGAIYADLDNDGDYDIVTNNINDEAFIYKNNQLSNPLRKIIMKGSKDNPNAIGAKVYITRQNGNMQFFEKMPTHGFLSSVEEPLLASIESGDEILVIWPDQTYESLTAESTGNLTVIYKEKLPTFTSDLIKEESIDLEFYDYTDSIDLEIYHIENAFNEFDREPLIPLTSASEGPALAVGDLNKDGLDDIFLGSSKKNKAKTLLQTPSGLFIETILPAIEADSVYEDTDALILDFNKDGINDLLVLSGGSEYRNASEYTMPRLYLQSENGTFKKDDSAFSDIHINGKVLSVADFNKDGYPDIFLGARSEPWQYGKKPNSYLVQNDGKGKFTPIANVEIKGMVKDAIWLDHENLIIAYEWGAIDRLNFSGGKITTSPVSENNGWWNGLITADFDNDGDEDIIALNSGENTRWNGQSIKMFVSDFDDNGSREQIITYSHDGKEIPFANKIELQTQIPFLKKKYLHAADFAKTSIEDLVNTENSEILTASFYKSVYLENQGDMTFKSHQLPNEIQYSSMKSGIVKDINNDGKLDVILVGNFYGNNIQLGRNDANFGSILINEGNGQFEYADLPGLTIKGESRKIKPILIQDKEMFVIARNNESLKIIGYE
ncbi:FG-GAP repeat domain-containing protein [Portibacter lacus]|uniref:ASPIC/UnbV domain-containing protein n=1 Tax=Portibacter lacus TaxID=1099794 RepID=A0AA37WFA1_9BACT|nr:VCBS repeat-containing protein [Portibacter lacus]GLR16800.1 hypothetical protein GCM10007940_14150 [Portibacter lacus]